MKSKLKLVIIKRTAKVLIVFAFFFTIFVTFKTLAKVFLPNIIIGKQEECYIFIPTGSNIDDVYRILYKKNYILNKSNFEWLVEKKKYAKHIRPGKYKLKNKMSNNELINNLRSGKQEIIKISINRILSKEDLAQYISHELEADSVSLMRLMENDSYLSKYNLTSYTVLTLIIPNSYNFLWNTSAEEFLDRMNKECKRFWNKDRKNKALEIGMKPEQVVILASIVNEETNIISEYPVIAGVYMNRLKMKMPLQADPTIKYALGKIKIKRILHKHTEFRSAYNTYLYSGLPPGPISIPSIKSIDAVLNYQKHSYLYFCANSDFSGSHLFAKTLSQHNRNAEAYQNALNSKKVFD
jgi:UPF0755 protein